jgi:hypothetical protein
MWNSLFENLGISVLKYKMSLKYLSNYYIKTQSASATDSNNLQSKCTEVQAGMTILVAKA